MSEIVVVIFFTHLFWRYNYYSDRANSVSPHYSIRTTLHIPHCLLVAIMTSSYCVKKKKYRFCSDTYSRPCYSTKNSIPTTAPICTSKHSTTCLLRNLTSLLTVVLCFPSDLRSPYKTDKRKLLDVGVHSLGECIVVLLTMFYEQFEL